MTQTVALRESKATARLAGLWYLLLGIGAGFSWMHITKVYVPDDALKTAANINIAQTAYIISIIAASAGQLCFLFLALTLYRLFVKVDELQALIMAVLVCVSVPIMFIGIVFQTGAFVLLNRAHYTGLLSPEHVAASALMSLQMYFVTVKTVQIFWGLWLIPFATLALKSGFFPKVLCYLLFVSAGGYVLGSVSTLVSPSFHNLIEKYLSIPQALGEIIMIFFLLIAGVRPAKVRNEN